jgi:pyruvate/oxaloacetate carboxyltransferase
VAAKGYPMSRAIRFTDVTLRDGQQSLAATRMGTAQALRVLSLIDRAGFRAMELWGGATLDSSIRFLAEDPFDRLEKFRETLGGPAKIQALLRGQNLFAYQPFPDDLVIAFVKHAVESGVGIMRIFDALNDFRNLQLAMVAVKAYGAKAEAALAYTTSPVHTTEYFVEYARLLEAHGADQLAIKDMSGILHPKACRELIAGLKRAVKIPIALHTHSTTGVSLLNSVIAMTLGIDSIDCSITPFAGGSSHAPVEVLVVFAEAMGLDHGLDKPLLLRIQKELFGVFEELKKFIPYAGKFYRPVAFEDVDRRKVDQVIALAQSGTPEAFEKAVPISRQILADLKYPDFDDGIFTSQIPGGMYTNLVNQLKEMGRPEILQQTLEECPRVRADVGYVPLVTPTSQIVGSQAAFNVLFGQRYAFVSNEFKMILRGELGRTPAPCNPELVARALGENERPLRYRAAAYLMPVLEDPCDLPFVRTHRDRLLHHMLGQAADGFLKRKYGLTD